MTLTICLPDLNELDHHGHDLYFVSLLNAFVYIPFRICCSSRSFGFLSLLVLIPLSFQLLILSSYIYLFAYGQLCHCRLLSIILIHNIIRFICILIIARRSENIVIDNYNYDEPAAC